MKVYKFGGTSVGSAENLNRIKDILLLDDSKKLVVCSAMSGVTDQLVQLADAVASKNQAAIQPLISNLKSKHDSVARALIQESKALHTALSAIEAYCKDLESLAIGSFSSHVYAQIVTYGETLLTTIFSIYLQSEGVSNIVLDAKRFMQIDSIENPSIDPISELLKKQLTKESQLYITQGFVCVNKKGELRTLNRGGSDYTATLIATAIHADEVQIWTDIDGLHNNDPRYVDDTKPIAYLTYNEAAELAYFGAKILHPQTVSPLLDKQIPVLLKNTFDPKAIGTTISSVCTNKGLKAISAKDGITVIKIKSNRMLMAHGYLRKIFEVFDAYQTPIDMITTSEVAISLTIDTTKNLDHIVKKIASHAEIQVEEAHSIICIVGEYIISDQKSYRLFEILNKIPIRMISYGGSNNNISLLVATEHKVSALRFLQSKLF